KLNRNLHFFSLWCRRNRLSAGKRNGRLLNLPQQIQAVLVVPHQLGNRDIGTTVIGHATQIAQGRYQKLFFLKNRDWITAPRAIFSHLRTERKPTAITVSSRHRHYHGPLPLHL